MTIKYITDTAANDSDKTLTVPDRRQWHFIVGHAELATTATVGNRQVDLVIGDGTDDIITVPAGGTQAASLTRQYEYIQGEAVGAAAAGTRFVVPVSVGLILPPGWTIQVVDSAAVDAAADDLVLRFLVDERAWTHHS